MACRSIQPLMALATLASVMCSDLPRVAQAQTYPDKPIRLVVPFPPGGPTDVTARLVAQELTTSLGQAMVVENIGGAGGTIGSTAVARAPADGYSLLYGSTSTLAIAPSAYSKLAYDPLKSFVPVGLAAIGPHVLFVDPKLPVSSVSELIAYIKKNPGKINYGSPGVGTPNHLAAELFKKSAGIDAVHVPYKGGAPALTGVMGGEVQFAFDTVSVVAPAGASGRVRMLALAASKRSELLPDLPTTAEAGLSGVEAASWNGIVAPAGTPPAVTERLNAEMQKALRNKDVLAKLSALGLDAAYLSPQQFQAFIADELQKWSRAATEAGVKLD
jgi:tripartite-type tricarboxylate transporter receptor subunit TctC